MSDPALSAGTPIEILVAEDSPTQALKLQQILEQQGYQVTIATDGFNCMAKGWKGHGVKILKPGATLAASFRLVWGE